MCRYGRGRAGAECVPFRVVLASGWNRPSWVIWAIGPGGYGVQARMLECLGLSHSSGRGIVQATTSPVARVLALLAVVILLLTACGGGDDPLEPSTSPEPPTTEATTTTAADEIEPAPLHLAFDGGSCTYEGPTELTPGPVELLFLNKSQGGAAVNMVYIKKGYTIQDVIDDLGPEPSTKHHPPWTYELGTWKSTAPGESHHWEGDLAAGLYAMVCARLSPDGDTYLDAWFGTGLTVEG